MIYVIHDLVIEIQDTDVIDLSENEYRFIKNEPKLLMANTDDEV